MPEVISSVDSLFFTTRAFQNVVPTGGGCSVHQLKNAMDLREGFLYYALTVNEELPKKQTAKFNTMHEFFDKLKTERKRPESDINKLKDVFNEQGILFDDLIETGELAITDEKLKDYGITQGGLRTAILAVIKTNIQ
jgi:hypothetical protein